VASQEAIDRVVEDLQGTLDGAEIVLLGEDYRPETERVSHYVEARAADQFDALVHIDRTTALEPLERWALGNAVPDTIPSGL
jgi:erythromycin esterase-like protein